MRRSAKVAPFAWAPAATEPALSHTELMALLGAMQTAFDWRDLSADVSVVRAWSSRTATLYQCRSALSPGRDVVLKMGRGWGSNDARLAWESLRSVARALNAGGSRTRVPDPLGWSAAPPCLCMQYVPGTDLFFMLGDLCHEAWRQSGASRSDLIAECGRALGAFHSWGRRRSAAGALAGADISSAPLFGDFGCHQFRLASDRTLYLLDAPIGLGCAPIHRDIATFTSSLKKVLATDGRGPGDRVPRLRVALCESFLRGYAETGPCDVRAPEHRVLIATYEARAFRGLVAKRLRNGDIREGVRNAGRWIASRAEAHVRSSDRRREVPY